MNDDAINFAQRDLFLTIIGIFVAIIAVLALMVNEPTKDESVPPGSLIVTMFWPEGATDVDLWLMGPGETKPIGFNNKSGKVWNLLRDDLGTTNDVLPLNYENAFSRGAPEGKYSIEVFCYNCSGDVPVSIKLEKSFERSTITIQEEVIVLHFKGDRRTFLNFTIDKNGMVIAMDRVQKALF